MLQDLGNNTEDTILKFLKKLEDQKIGPAEFKNVKYEATVIEDIVNCDKEIATKLFNEPTPFLFDEVTDEVYIEVDLTDEELSLLPADSKIKKCKYYIESNTEVDAYDEMCNHILNVLTAIPYDTYCDGVLSKKAENNALYSCCIVNKFSEGEYADRIDGLLLNYDYEHMRTADGELGFVQLLKVIQEEAGQVSKTILMCCTTKLISHSQKNDTSYEMYLSQVDTERLKLCLDRNSDLSVDFSEQYKASKTPLEKATVGESLDEARKTLLVNIRSQDADGGLLLLFRIATLNLNAVPERKTRQIRSKASDFTHHLKAEGILVDDEQLNLLKKRLIKRAQKLFLSRMKVQRYILWNKGVREDLIPKY